MPPELSVVIPTLNEAQALPLLLADLAAQAGVACEVLVSDGGSADGTREVATASLAQHGLAGLGLGHDLVQDDGVRLTRRRPGFRRGGRVGGHS